MAKTILIVEDEAELAELVALHLRDDGYEVEIEADGRRGLERILRTGIDLVILDQSLPSMDGLEICRQVRARGPWVPILMLTARSAELDRVLGLEVGADDYLTKPFSVRELTARVRAILRRIDAVGQAQEEGTVLRFDGLEIDGARRRVARAGEPVYLTAREFDLLLHFARNPGLVFTRAQLLDQVWGYGHDGYEHTVNSHINRLRAKIEDDARQPSWILTVWGVGYRFADEAAP